MRMRDNRTQHLMGMLLNSTRAAAPRDRQPLTGSAARNQIRLRAARPSIPVTSDAACDWHAGIEFRQAELERVEPEHIRQLLVEIAQLGFGRCAAQRCGQPCDRLEMGLDDIQIGPRKIRPWK